MNTQAAGAPLIDPIMERLEDQIGWYDRKSLLNPKRNFKKRIKIIEITAAALIPFVSAFNFPRMAWVSGGLGVLITVLEGMLHLNQYEQNWITYRSTCESLKHEKYVYLGEGRAVRRLGRRARGAGRQNRSAGLAGTRQMGVRAAAAKTKCWVIT